MSLVSPVALGLAGAPGACALVSPEPAPAPGACVDGATGSPARPCPPHALFGPDDSAATSPGAQAAPLAGPPLPGPAPRPTRAEVAGIGLPTDEGCARCHEEIAAEHRASLHRHAWENTYFRRAYALEPGPFCRKCHAPEADPAAEPPEAARLAGVGCTTCHVPGAEVVGTRALTATRDGHAVLGDPRLATPAACGGCHDFPFPGPPGKKTGPMQDTLGEHRRSAASNTPCQDCHMPLTPGKAGRPHRSHAFRVQGDREMLARGVEVREASLSRGEVRLSLAPGAIGHAFPTGDLNRQVEVRATPLDAAGRPLRGGASVILGRTFGAARGEHAALYPVERSDTRLTAPRTITLAVPPEASRVGWEIVWRRLPPDLARELHMDVREHETVVVSGMLTR